MGQQSSKPGFPPDDYLTDEEGHDSKNPFSEWQILSGHSDIVRTMLKLDGRRMASGSDDHCIIIWNYETGEQIFALNGHTRPVTCLLHIAENLLASGSSDRTVKIWNLDNGECVHTLCAHEGSVKCLVKLGQDKFCSGANDQKLIVWDFNGRMLSVMERNEDDNILALLPISNNRMIVASNSKYLLVYDVQLQIQTEILDFHRESVQCLIHVSDDLFASASLDGAIHVWSTETLTPVRTLNYHDEYGDGHRASYLYKVHHLAVLNEHYLAAAINNGFSIYDLHTGECVSTCRDAHDATVLNIAPLTGGDQTFVASCSADSTVRIWQAFKSTAAVLPTPLRHSSAPLPSGTISGSASTRSLPPLTPLVVSARNSFSNSTERASITPPQTPYTAYQTPPESVRNGHRRGSQTESGSELSSSSFPGMNLENIMESEFQKMKSKQRTLLSSAVTAAAASQNGTPKSEIYGTPPDVVGSDHESVGDLTSPTNESDLSTPATALHRSLLVPEGGGVQQEGTPLAIDFSEENGDGNNSQSPPRRKSRSFSSLSDSSLPLMFPLTGSFRSSLSTNSLGELGLGTTSQSGSPAVLGRSTTNESPSLSDSPSSTHTPRAGSDQGSAVKLHRHHYLLQRHNSRNKFKPDEQLLSRSLPTNVDEHLNVLHMRQARRKFSNSGGSGSSGATTHRGHLTIVDSQSDERKAGGGSQEHHPMIRTIQSASSLDFAETPSKNSTAPLQQRPRSISSATITLNSLGEVSENHFRASTPRGSGTSTPSKFGNEALSSPVDPLKPPPSNPILKQPDKTFMAKQGWLSGLFGLGQKKGILAQSKGIFVPQQIAILSAHSDVVHCVLSLDENCIASCGSDGLVTLFKNGRMEGMKRSDLSRDLLIQSLFEQHREAIALGHFSWVSYPRDIVNQQLQRKCSWKFPPPNSGTPSPVHTKNSSGQLGDSDDVSTSDFVTPRLRFEGEPQTTKRRPKRRQTDGDPTTGSNNEESRGTGDGADSVHAEMLHNAGTFEDLCDSEEEETRVRGLDNGTLLGVEEAPEDSDLDEFLDSRTAAATPFENPV